MKYETLAWTLLVLSVDGCRYQFSVNNTHHAIGTTFESPSNPIRIASHITHHTGGHEEFLRCSPELVLRIPNTLYTSNCNSLRSYCNLYRTCNEHHFQQIDGTILQYISTSDRFLETR